VYAVTFPVLKFYTTCRRLHSRCLEQTSDYCITFRTTPLLKQIAPERHVLPLDNTLTATGTAGMLTVGMYHISGIDMM
jgi:hypothetical protein